MKRQDFIARLAKDYNAPADKLEKLIPQDVEEVEIELPELTVFTAESLEKFKTEYGSTKYNEGKTAGSEMTVKEIKKLAGLEIEGKDPNVVLSEYQKKVLADAKIEPEKKVKEITEKFESLQKTYQTDMAAKDSEIQKFQTLVVEKDINHMIIQQMPALDKLKPAQAAVLFKTEYEVKKTDTGVEVYKGGQLLKDKLEKPIPLDDVLSSYLKESGFIGADGRGGGNEPGGSGHDFKTMNDVFNYLKDQKIDYDSPEGEKFLEKHKDLPYK